MIDIPTISSAFTLAENTLKSLSPNITIFGSARIKHTDYYYQQAQQLAQNLSYSGFNIITGGGPGIMEAANKGAFLGKSKSIGITISLPNEQSANKHLDICIPTEHFFVRKVMLIQYSQIFICFPGGFGTLDELFEILNLQQTGKMQSALIYLVGVDFWHHLSRFIHTTKTQNLINTQQYFHIFDNIDDIYADILSHHQHLLTRD